MSAMTREQFTEKATSGTLRTHRDVETWAKEAGALLGVLSLRPDTPHDVMVEAIQTVALRMPGRLVMDSTGKLADVDEEFRL